MELLGFSICLELGESLLVQNSLRIVFILRSDCLHVTSVLYCCRMVICEDETRQGGSEHYLPALTTRELP